MKDDSSISPPDSRRPSMSMDDAQLLRRYVDERSQEAFAELVQRHVNVVYFAALRRVGGDSHLADDVAQKVFSDLARKAPSLKDRKVLTGWLYTSTRFAAAQAVRSEQRRRTHEQEAQTMRELETTPYLDWNQVRPVIDDVLDELSEPEREAVLLRFFENLPLAEVGARFSLSADAARMRVERALDKLRGRLARRGIVSTSAALATVFTAQSGVAAPASLVARIVAGALGPAGAATTATLAAWKIAAGVAAGVAGIGLVTYKVVQMREPAPIRTEATAGYETIADAAGVTPPRPAAVANATTPEIEEVAPRTPSALPAPAPTLAPAPAAATQSFAELSIRQKSILKNLWEHRKLDPQAAPASWGFKPGSAATAAFVAEFQEAAALLAESGLVRSNPTTGSVSLTREGDAFCQAHAAELDAFATKPTIMAPARFEGLATAQRDILKTLWEHHKVSPDRPPLHWSFKVSPDSPNFSAFQLAAAALHEVNGLVGVSANTGAVFLNERGRAFCEAHAAEIDAYPLPPRNFRPAVPDAPKSSPTP